MYLPQALDRTLEMRQLGYGGRQNRYRRRTPWSSWGRWVLAGILIFIGLVLLFLILCCSRRRKRRNQLKYSTNTPMAPQPQYNQSYGNQEYNQGGYAPPAGAPPTYGGGGPNDGYYGQQGGVTQPQGAYVK